jgi:Spy/CpxP family protein refolding chaperone
MKHQLIKFVATGALAAGMAFAQSAPATPAPNGQSSAVQKGRHNFARNHWAKISQELNLTDAQKAQAKTIFGQARETAKPVREELKANREALRAAVKADRRSEIAKLSTERGNLMGKMLAVRTEAAAKFYQVLTPEQRAKADQLHQQFRQRTHERFNQRNAG